MRDCCRPCGRRARTPLDRQAGCCANEPASVPVRKPGMELQVLTGLTQRPVQRTGSHRVERVDHVEDPLREGTHVLARLERVQLHQPPIWMTPHGGQLVAHTEVIQTVTQAHPREIAAMTRVSRRGEPNAHPCPSLRFDEGQHAHQPKRRKPSRTAEIDDRRVIDQRRLNRSLNHPRRATADDDKISHESAFLAQRLIPVARAPQASPSLTVTLTPTLGAKQQCSRKPRQDCPPG